MTNEYLVKKETLDNIADAVRSVTGGSAYLSLNDISLSIRKLSSSGSERSYECFVGMMQPYNTVGKDGDLFFLV